MNSRACARWAVLSNNVTSACCVNRRSGSLEVCAGRIWGREEGGDDGWLVGIYVGSWMGMGEIVVLENNFRRTRCVSEGEDVGIVREVFGRR